MTVYEMLNLANSGLQQVGKNRYKTGTSTGAGAADGTTVVSTSLGGIDDAWNNAEIRITSGDNNRQRRRIGDFVNSTGTITVVDAFTHQVASGITFEIGEKGFVSDSQLLELFTKCKDELLYLLVNDVFAGMTDELEIAGTAGVSAALPSTLAGPPISVNFKDLSNNIYDVILLSPGEQDRFREDGFLGQGVDDMVAIFKNGLIHYRPKNNGTLLLEVLPQLSDVTVSSGSPLPAFLHQLQVDYAIYKGWYIKERTDLGDRYKADFERAVAAINNRYANDLKLESTHGVDS